MKSNWLNTCLIDLSFHYKLYVKPQQFFKDLKAYNLSQVDYLNGKDGCTHFFTCKREGRTVNLALVCLGSVEEASPVQVAALLVHEAVHVWQQHVKFQGEDQPSDEYEAYAIQAISQNLMLEYLRLTTK
jgi:hypothetical protein